MKISDTVVGVGFVGAGALIVAGTLHYPILEAGHPGPSLFPRIVGTLMAAFGLLVAVQGFRARDVTEAVAWRRLHRSAGFVNALFVLMWRLEVRPLRALVVAIVFNTLVHFLFAKILRVPLPLGILWW